MQTGRVSENFSLPLPYGRGSVWGCVVTGAIILSLAACSGTPEQREAKYMERGKKEFAAKQYKKAVIDFKIAAQNMPKDAEPVYQLGMVYLTAGAAKQAVEAFTKAVGLNPNHEGAQYQMALVKVTSNKADTVTEARKVLEAYVPKHPDSAEALGALALAQAKLGDKDLALKNLYAAAAKDPTNMRSAALVIALYAARGDTDTAKQIAHELAERLPNSPDAIVLRAQVSLATKDTADADAQIHRALELKRDFRPALELELRRELMTNDPGAAEQTTQELAKQPQERLWGAYARMLFAERKVDQGIAEYNKAIKDHDNNAQLRDEYSAALTSVNRKADAEAIASGTIAKNPKDRTALMQRTTLELDRGDIEAGAKDVKALQELKAFSPQLSYEESRIMGARGETVKEGDLLADALKGNPRMLIARLELSRVLTAAGNPKVALETLEQATPREKNTAQWVFYNNTALMASGDWIQARKNVDAALKVMRSPGFLYQDAVLKVRDRDLAGARKSLDESFQKAPNDHLTINLLGQVMRMQKQSPEFTALLKEAAAKNPNSPVLASALGAQLESTGDVTGAQAAFEKQKAAGDPVTAENDLALIELKSGKLDDARKRLTELIKTHDNAPSRLMLAEIETKKGASADVVAKHYLRALDLQPSNVAAMNNLADLLAVRQSKYEDALFWAQKALSLAPNSPIVEDTVGWIYYREKKFDAALPYLEKSAKGLDRPVAHYHLAGVLANEGDWTRAKKEYELAMKEDPRSDARTQVSGLFEKK